MEIGIFVFIIFFSFSASAIRINEVELNPEGSDTGKEWIELYSENEISLENYSIKNNDNQTLNLTGNFSGFLVINFSGQWLDNLDEKVFLFYNSSLIDETVIFSDSSNDNRTWQYCSNWTFTFSTKNSENSCPQQNQSEQNEENQENQSQNEVYLELGHDDEVYSEFEVEVRAYNLGGSYDVKIYLTYEKDKIISETYDDGGEKWKSSSYYTNNIFNGTGNKNKTLKLRLDEDYGDFSGDAKIKVKLRKSGSSSIVAEFEDDIEILKLEEESSGNGKNETEKSISKSVLINEDSAEVIELNPKDIKSSQEYKSKTQYIREYAIYAFALFCVFIIVLLIKRKFR